MASRDHRRCTGKTGARVAPVHGPAPAYDGGALDVFVARQPIFDEDGEVIAYELLFRTGLKNAVPAVFDPDAASARVINDALLVFGFDSLTAGRTAYVNTTRSVLEERLYAVLPARRTALELLETLRPDPEVVALAREARDAGYRIVLDDFVYRPELAPLVALADVVKVDFLASPVDERRRTVDAVRARGRKLLAEKIETKAQQEDAAREGYTLFQGYFFARPEMIARRDVAPSKLTYLRFLRELQASDLSYDRIEPVIKQDVALSVKLLRYLNSAAFGWRARISSVKHALVLLGDRAFRQWASLLAVVSIAADHPEALAATCLQRARYCELMAPQAGLPEAQLDAFFVGLLSAMDALVGRPMPEVLSEIGVPRGVMAALCRGDAPPTRLAQLLDLALAYERGAWDEVAALAANLGLADAALAEAYRESLEWARRTMPPR